MHGGGHLFWLRNVCFRAPKEENPIFRTLLADCVALSILLAVSLSVLSPVKVLHLVRKFLPTVEIEYSSTHSQKAPLGHMTSQPNSVHTASPSLSRNYFNIIQQFMLKHSKWPLLFSSLTKILYEFLILLASSLR